MRVHYKGFNTRRLKKALEFTGQQESFTAAVVESENTLEATGSLKGSANSIQAPELVDMVQESTTGAEMDLGIFLAK